MQLGLTLNPKWCNLGRVWCSRLTGPRVVLVGDAAHAVTPVGGQGANAALEDTLFLSNILQSTGTSCCTTCYSQKEKKYKPVQTM